MSSFSKLHPVKTAFHLGVGIIMNLALINNLIIFSMRRLRNLCCSAQEQRSAINFKDRYNMMTKLYFNDFKHFTISKSTENWLQMKIKNFVYKRFEIKIANKVVFCF